MIHWTEFLQELGIHDGKPATVYEDNQQCIRWAETNMINIRNRAVEVKYHRIRDYVQRNWIKVFYRPTDHMVADIFTKPLSKPVFEKHRTALRMVEVAKDC